MRYIVNQCFSLSVILAITVLFIGIDGLWSEENPTEPKQEVQKEESKEPVQKEEAQEVKTETKSESKEESKLPAKEEPKLFTSKGKAGKNLQVLAIDSIADLQKTMKTITKSVGADCKFCHILLDFTKDEKTLKKDLARKMMVMVDEINDKYFKEMNLKITCITCHQRRKEPILNFVDWEKMKAGEATAKSEIANPSDSVKKPETTAPQDVQKK